MHEHLGGSQKGNQQLEMASGAIGFYESFCLYCSLDRISTFKVKNKRIYSGGQLNVVAGQSHVKAKALICLFFYDITNYGTSTTNIGISYGFPGVRVHSEEILFAQKAFRL